jgi:hypothetical protein
VCQGKKQGEDKSGKSVHNVEIICFDMQNYFFFVILPWKNDASMMI